MQNLRDFFHWPILIRLFYPVVYIAPFALLCLFLWFMGVNFGPGGTTAALELLMGLLIIGFGVYLVVRVVRGTLHNGWYALHRSSENVGMMVGGIIIMLLGVLLVVSFFGCLLFQSCPHLPFNASND